MDREVAHRHLPILLNLHLLLLFDLLIGSVRNVSFSVIGARNPSLNDGSV